MCKKGRNKLRKDETAAPGGNRTRTAQMRWAQEKEREQRERTSTTTRGTPNNGKPFCPAGQSASMHHLSPAFFNSLSSVLAPRLRGLTGSPPPKTLSLFPPLAFAFAAFLPLCASGNRSLGGQLGSGEKAGCSTGSLDPRGGEIGLFLARLYIGLWNSLRTPRLRMYR
jgi:hypothetical protein